MKNEIIYNLRPAKEADFDFVKNIHHQTLRDYVEPIWGWDEKFQDDQVKKRFIPERFQIVTQGAKDIGILVVEHNEREFFITSISITPRLQSRGIGRKIICDIVTRAKAEGKCTSLQVLKTNKPARKLYERLGFHVLAESEYHFQMSTQTNLS